MPTSIILIVGLGIAFLLLIIGLVVSVREERAGSVERIDRYLEEQAPAGAAGTGETATPLTDWLNTQVGRFSWAATLSRDLARADLKLRVGEYVALMIIAAFGTGFIVWFLAGHNTHNLLPGIIGAVVGFFLPRIYVRREQGKRLLHFDDQLSDMLNLMVNGLRAGYSTLQAMEAVSKELPPPICDEFRRVVQEMQLGVSMERALDNLLRRIPSKDLDLVITALNVQREVGGNLAEILATISHTIRERVRIKGEIRVMTSQVLTSAKFLSGMPIFVIVVLYFINRSYIMEFFAPKTRLVGIPALICSGLLIITGYYVMTKIAAIEV
jgi:tight adherence protein B